jgi:hypothetical protein
MYRVVVTSRGKDNNVTLGARYCLTKRSAISLAVTFETCECEYDIEKFVRIHGDIFAWSDAIDEKIWEKISEALDNEVEE